ncbi:MAG: hypothetical protein RL204_1956 [Bacteroidota bacterium]|jgi:outer membrane protein assembly factor BamB
MIKHTTTFLIFIAFSNAFYGQFNNYYLTDLVGKGAGWCIEENVVTGNYLVPLAHGQLDIGDNNYGILEIDPQGELLENHFLSQVSTCCNGGSRAGFFRTSDNGFIYALGIDGPVIFKLNAAMELEWSAQDNDPNYFYMGGTELDNGDVIVGKGVVATPFTNMPMRRYSSTGEFLFEFNIELDHICTSTTAFVAKDDFIYVSFHRQFIGSDDERSNIIVCYNATTGEEIWELYHSASGIAYGFIDPVILLSNSNELHYVYGQIEGYTLQGVLDIGIFSRIKIAALNEETGGFLEQTEFGNLISELIVIDSEPTLDGGLVILSKGFEGEDSMNYGMRISKLDENGTEEWTYYYYPPDLYDSNDVQEILYDIDLTSDGCYVAAGYALGPLPDFSDTFQFPWVLKIDACGNQIVTDCDENGVFETNWSASTQIYPNPAQDRIFIRSKEFIKRAELFDLQGRKVFEENFSGGQEQTLFIDHLPAGLYLTVITTQNGNTCSERIVVE